MKDDELNNTSNNIENTNVYFINIMSNVCSSILKISQKWLRIPIFIVVTTIMCALLTGFYFLPFINYKYLSLKIIFACIWVFSAFLLCNLYLSQKPKDKKDILANITTILFFGLSFGLIFVHNNFYSFGNVANVISLVLCILIILTSAVFLVELAKPNPKLFLQSVILAIMGIVLFLLFYGTVITGASTDLVDLIIGFISFFGMVSLLLGYCITCFFKSDKVKHVYIYGGIIIGTIIILLLISYIVSYIDNTINIMNTFVMLLSSTIAGGLTLFGVAWTIKNSEKNIKLDYKMRNKPILILVNKRCMEVLLVEISGDIKTAKYAIIRETADKENELGFIIKNIAPMPCKIIGVNYLGRIIECENKNIWVENQEFIWFGVQINDFKYPGEIELIVEDISKNKYYYLLNYNTAGEITDLREKEV